MEQLPANETATSYHHPEAFNVTSPAIRLLSRVELDLLLEETQAEGLRLHAILNQSQHPALLDSFYSTAEALEYSPLFGETSYAPLLRKSPLFFAIDEGNPFWLSLQKERVSWGFVAIGCPETPHGLAHWRSLLNALLPDDTLTHFRYYSGNILLRTANAATSLEVQWLAGPYAYLVVPYPPSSETPWALISNPVLHETSARETAEKHTVAKDTWWQVTDAHLAAFEPTLDKIYKRNLVTWLWENYFEETKKLNDRENIHTAIDDMLQQAKKWGFALREQQTRCIAALLPFAIVSEPLGEEGEILRQAAANPEVALQRLEALAARRRNA
ncbi:MAG: hypothetical protein DELT_02483 [Desulfovibrio sp.]